MHVRTRTCARYSDSDTTCTHSDWMFSRSDSEISVPIDVSAVFFNVSSSVSSPKMSEKSQFLQLVRMPIRCTHLA